MFFWNHSRFGDTSSKHVLLISVVVVALRQPHFDEDVFNRYIQGILYKRNKRMLKRIIPYLNDGSAFIAVGALHLAGENGLLRVLKNKNYHVTRVY